MIKDQFGDTYYRVALHLHTKLSDGRKTPEEVAEEYKAGGYDAIAFTDHWRYGAGGELCGLHILPGAEYNLGGNDTSGCVMHIVGIGMQYDPEISKESSRQQVVDAINAAGGIAVLAHPAWSVNTLADSQALEGITATEIFNAVSEAGMSMRAYSDHFVDACANAGIYWNIFATDDAHYYEGADNRRGWVMVKADELSDEAILKALRSGDFYATQGPALSVKREGNTLVIDSSPCSVIGTMSNLAWAANRVARGENLTHSEYEIKEKETWIRVEVIDAQGRHAWSNIIVV